MKHITKELKIKTKNAVNDRKIWSGVNLSSKNDIRLMLSDIGSQMDKLETLKSDNLCGQSFSFSNATEKCIETCAYRNYNCNGHGTCYVDTHGVIGCSCKADASFVYSGPACTVKTEKLKIKSKYIIAAFCGSGGFIILVAIIVCVVCRSRGTKEKYAKDYYITEHDTLSYNHPTGLLGRQRTPTNLYFPMNDDIYTREHRNYTIVEGQKKHGGYTYMYNPSAKPAADLDADIKTNNTYYNKSFCSEEFSIKRPQIRSDRDSPYKEFNSRPKVHQPDYM